MVKIEQDECFVTIRECDLHRALVNEKLAATNKRVDGILEEIQEVRHLQTRIYNTIIAIAILTLCTLVGVLLGRGIDLGWFIP